MCVTDVRSFRTIVTCAPWWVAPIATTSSVRPSASGHSGISPTAPTRRVHATGEFDMNAGRIADLTHDAIEVSRIMHGRRDTDAERGQRVELILPVGLAST